MNTTPDRSTEDWERFVGDQCRAARIRAMLEQAQLAALAGISVGAMANLEGGKGSSLKTLIKVLRALKRTDWLESLAPPVSVSPLQLLKSQRTDRPRQRIRRRTRERPPG
jgi:transcriptional regulator with XRE-family HTH domain